MNESITIHLNTFATLIAEIKNTETIEYSSISIEMQLYSTFTELPEEVYELLLGDPVVAAKEMEGGLGKIDGMLLYHPGFATPP